MLLKFTTTDMLNSALIDVSTGERAYDIITVVLPPTPNSKTNSTDDDALSSSQIPTPKECRRTCITNSTGSILVSISWNGRQPDIKILDEKIGGLTDLFGSTTVRFMPKILAIPTRFDTEYIWTATPDSLTLFDYDSELTKGTFYQNAIRLPGSFKSKPKDSTTLDPSPSSPSPALSPSSSSSSLRSSASSTPSSTSSSSSLYTSPILKSTHTNTPRSSFISTHLPGLGGNYLEFCQHPLAHDVEIIVSFLMMEILRRGRFLLTPYTFDKPKMWQLKEARDLVLRRIRRNTV